MFFRKAVERAYVENKDCWAKKLLEIEFPLRSILWMWRYACKMPVLLSFFCSCLISPAGAGGFDEASHMDGVALFELRRRM